MADAIQLYRAGGQVSDDTVHKAAAEGLRGSAEALPHFEQIQHAFGPQHDLSGVQAYVGGAAAEASEAMGAQAYATGNAVAFRDTPDLHLAAHEAAHVVQQRAGVNLEGGVGSAGDSYEKHADAVADRVVSGRSATDLLPSGGGGGGAEIQRYGETADATWRVSDDDKAAVSQDSGGGGQTLYATQDLIDNANQKLETAGTKGSFIRLEAADDEIEYEGNTLHSVAPRYHDASGDGSVNTQMNDANTSGKADATGDSSDKFAMYSDCGRSSRSVMGSQGEMPKAVVKMYGREQETRRAGDPGKWTDQIYYNAMAAFVNTSANKQYFEKGAAFRRPKSGAHAKQMWGTLTEEGKRAFAMYAGINEGANPEVGEGYTMATGYDLPGFARQSDMTWNFHWAGVVMKTGGDNITLENYAIMFPKTGDPQKDAENRQRAYDWTNKDWVFQMYGTKEKGQTFHEQHLDSGTHGSAATSFRVRI